LSWSSRPLSRIHGLARRQQELSIRGFDMRATSRYLDPSLATRRWITAGLIAAGAVAGAVIGLALTVLGKVVAGAPPADPANYTWNAGVFAVLGAVLAPLVTWSALRRVPLWRTIVEPLAGAVVGAGLGVLLGSGAAFLLLTPLGAAAAVTRLSLAHRRKDRPRLRGAPE